MENRSKKAQLQKIAEEIEACALCRKDKIGLAVVGEGSAEAEIAFIGEAPGKEEAKIGRPFVGRSGKFLRAAIREIGLKEEDIYIVSPVKYLPQRGTPSQADIDHGRGHLFRQLAIIDPKILVLLGGVACRAVLGREAAVSREHGKIVETEGRSCLITFHPAAAMRFPKIREEFYRDLKKLGSLIRSKGIAS